MIFACHPKANNLNPAIFRFVRFLDEIFQEKLLISTSF
jgi:hypothetical protein